MVEAVLLVAVTSGTRLCQLVLVKSDLYCTRYVTLLSALQVMMTFVVAAPVMERMRGGVAVTVKVPL